MTVGTREYRRGMGVLRDRPSVRDPAYSVPQSEVAAFRAACKVKGVSVAKLVDWPIRKLLHHVGDLDLAVTAATMFPRPAWVRRMIGDP